MPVWLNSLLMTWLDSFLPTFVPLFVVIDAIGNLPFIISFGEGLTSKERHEMICLAVLTATMVGLFFLFLGRLILSLMGISVGSFAIAGGLILVILSIRFMTTGHMVEIIKGEMVAAVPIGTPLTVGPATITTLLLLTTQFPIYLVLISFIMNMLIAFGVFCVSSQIVRLIGEGGIRVSSRVLSLLLGAIGVDMVIRGLGLIGVLNIKV